LSSALRPTRLAGLLILGALFAPAPAVSASAVLQESEEELAELLAEERSEADRLRRRGEFSEAKALLRQHLDDDEGDHASRALLGRVYLAEGGLERAERHLRSAIEGAAGTPVAAQAALDLARLLHRIGDDRVARREALPLLLEGEALTRPEALFVAAEVLVGLGERDEARQLRQRALRAGGEREWRDLLFRARCRQRLGDIEEAGSDLLRADRLVRGGEAEVLVALGDLLFEADREVAEAAGRSAAKLYDEALRLDATSEGALLGLFELHRVNYHRQRRRPGEFIARMLELRPRSVEAHLAACSENLRVGKLPVVRRELELLEELAPARREVRTLRAALAWVEHDRERCEEILAELLEVDPRDSGPEREVGKSLIELYRFAEALPFLERAVERDPDDYMAWTLLGRARANTGDEEGALAALQRSRRAGGLRQDAWRKNTRLVLERLDRDYVRQDFGELSFAFKPDAAAVLATYLEPFYSEAREELSRRYGYTPGPTHIEVFRRHQDFSVRSTGFEGFPALGVCFGPVVTALSPLAELRGSFSWARTSFHEFTHVIHLGLSHNRCPRWITEGLATWEEATRNPAWARNLRRDLVDARANDQVIPIRDLNAAFRGPRIIFGYYQGGLVCELLIERYGFPPVIRLLEAFDRGLDLDQALDEVYGLTPEELDAALALLVEEKTAELAIEPRWDPGVVSRQRLGLTTRVPEEAGARLAWQDGWCTQAWGAWQGGRRIDAEEALRQVRRAGDAPPRALFLMGAMAQRDGRPRQAVEHWEAGLEAGGEDFLVRILLGELRQGLGELEAAEEHFLAAERAFPGFDDADLAAELRLVGLYIEQDREDDAMRAAERYVRYDAGSYSWRRRLASWHARGERWERAAFFLHEANEIDPFSRELHREWARALEALERWEEALREHEVVGLVPPQLDLDPVAELSDLERAELFAARARCLVRLGRFEEAEELLREGEALGVECPELMDASALLEEARS